jgi:hypothetical protein
MNGWRKSAILGCLLLFAALTPLASMEIDSGAVRLILHEGIGRFSLYARTSATDYVPLFVDQDPRTSGISLVVNDKIYELGNGSDFTETVENATAGAMGGFEWNSRTLQVVQEFTPAFSSASGNAQGVRMSIRISNRSGNRLSVGLRLCLDTYLGEDNLSHFSSDRHQEIRSELTVTGSDMLRYWLSPSADAPTDLGLLCLTSGDDITPPDKIVFANWKRLSDASWDYQTSSSRNFNLMPYSINDSAVCMYYDPVNLAAHASREIVLVLANVTLGDYTGAQSAQEEMISAEAQARVEPETGSTPAAISQPETAPASSLQELRDRLDAEAGSAEMDLEELNNFVDLIDERLTAGQAISDEELRLMEEILSVIKEKSERYSGGR